MEEGADPVDCRKLKQAALWVGSSLHLTQTDVWTYRLRDVNCPRHSLFLLFKLPGVLAEHGHRAGVQPTFPPTLFPNIYWCSDPVCSHRWLKFHSSWIGVFSSSSSSVTQICHWKHRRQIQITLNSPPIPRQSFFNCLSLWPGQVTPSRRNRQIKLY